MKALPTIWSVLDFVDLIPSRLRRNQAPAGVNPHSSLSRASAKAQADYEEVSGFMVAKDYLETRNLVDVAPEDEPTLCAMGAVKVKNGWRVPDDIPDVKLPEFQRWMPLIPQDLREHEPKLLRTKHGRSIEGYLLPEDMADGNDSLATPLVYAAFPILSALAYFLMSVNGWLGLLVVPLLAPFFVGLAQSENASESMKALFLHFIAPLALASVLNSVSGASVNTGVMAGLLSSLFPPEMNMGQMIGQLVWGAGVITIIIVFPMIILGGNPTSSSNVIGGFSQKFKHAALWGAMWLVCFGIALLLPDGLGSAAFFVMACFSVLDYTEKNHLARAEELKMMGDLYGLGSDPKNQMATAERIRVEQIASAIADKTPTVVYAFAQGHLAIQRVAFAPDAGIPMVLSLRDMTMHVFGFGATGTGKTASMVRPTLLQLRAMGGVGALVRDGKQVLAAEMRQIIDIMVEPGVRIAVFQGLDAKQRTNALGKFIKVDESANKNPLWENGALLLLDHANTIQDALVEHEKGFREAAIKQARGLESNLDYLMLEMAKMDKQGRDLTQAKDQFDAVKAKRDDWALFRDRDRQYLTNVETLYRVITAINDTEVQNGITVPGKVFREMAKFLGYRADKMRVVGAPDTIHPELNAISNLDNSLNEIFGSWCKLDPGQRSSFAMNVFTNCIVPLMRGKDFRDAEGTPWSMLETGEDLGQALYGKWVGLNVNVNEHGQAADLIQALVVQRIYPDVLKRGKFGNKWQEMLPGQMPLIDCCDECQLVVGTEEANMAPIGRSLGIKLAFFTQGIESLAARFGDKNETAKFINTFQSIMALDCSPETKHYLAERFGEVMKLQSKSNEVGLNFRSVIKKWLASPLNDLHHPNRAVMSKIKQLGGGKISNARPSRDGTGGPGWDGHRTARSHGMTMMWGIQSEAPETFVDSPLFELNHFAMLKSKGTALVYLQRAGVPRVDVATLNYVSDETLDKMLADPEVVGELIKEAGRDGIPIEEMMNYYVPPSTVQLEYR